MICSNYRQFWTAPALWRYAYQTTIESGRRLPHSKTLPRPRKYLSLGVPNA